MLNKKWIYMMSSFMLFWLFPPTPPPAPAAFFPVWKNLFFPGDDFSEVQYDVSFYLPGFSQLVPVFGPAVNLCLWAEYIVSNHWCCWSGYNSVVFLLRIQLQSRCDLLEHDLLIGPPALFWDHSPCCSVELATLTLRKSTGKYCSTTWTTALELRS